MGRPGIHIKYYMRFLVPVNVKIINLYSRNAKKSGLFGNPDVDETIIFG
jgi:hypothetical protein